MFKKYVFPKSPIRRTKNTPVLKTALLPGNPPMSLDPKPATAQVYRQRCTYSQNNGVDKSCACFVIKKGDAHDMM